MKTNKLIAFSILLLAAPICTAQTTDQNINVTIRPSQTVEERVANEVKTRQLLKAAEEKIAEEEAAKMLKPIPQPSYAVHESSLSTQTLRSSNRFNCKTLCVNVRSLTTGKWQSSTRGTDAGSPM